MSVPAPTQPQDGATTESVSLTVPKGTKAALGVGGGSLAAVVVYVVNSLFTMHTQAMEKINAVERKVDVILSQDTRKSEDIQELKAGMNELRREVWRAGAGQSSLRYGDDGRDLSLRPDGTRSTP